MPSGYLSWAFPAAWAWSAGALASPDLPLLLHTVWRGIGPAAYWADLPMYWGLRGC